MSFLKSSPFAAGAEPIARGEFRTNREQLGRIELIFAAWKRRGNVRPYGESKRKFICFTESREDATFARDKKLRNSQLLILLILNGSENTCFQLKFELRNCDWSTRSYRAGRAGCLEMLSHRWGSPDS